MSDPFDQSTWTAHDRFYFGYVDEMLADKVDAPVSNVVPEHAAYLVSALLQSAEHQVRLFPGSLAPEGEASIYNAPAIAEAAKKLLSHDGSRFVIVLEDGEQDQTPIEEHPLVRSIMDFQKQGGLRGRMDVCMAPAPALEFLRAQDHGYPMMVMDESAYRVEGNNGREVAYANFGDHKTARDLAGLFDDVLYRDSKRVLAVEPDGVRSAAG